MRGTARELADRFADGARGEICIVVDGAGPIVTDLGAGVTRVLALTTSGGPA